MEEEKKMGAVYFEQWLNYLLKIKIFFLGLNIMDWTPNFTLKDDGNGNGIWKGRLLKLKCL